MKFPIDTIRQKAANAGKATARRHAMQIDGRGWTIRSLSAHLSISQPRISACIRRMTAAREVLRLDVIRERA